MNSPTFDSKLLFNSFSLQILILGLVTDMTFWGDVIVTPLEAAYVDKVMEPMYEDEISGEKSDEARTDSMDTQI